MGRRLVVGVKIRLFGYGGTRLGTSIKSRNHAAHYVLLDERLTEGQGCVLYLW
jgi:hypothetical protein